MTNYEKYKDKIEEIFILYDSSLALSSGEPIACDLLTSCTACQFGGTKTCNLEAIKWCVQECEPKSVSEQCENRSYDEMRAKIENQRGEPTRLLAENKGLKELMQKDIYKICDLCSRNDALDVARAEGQSEAWEMARKIALVDEEGAYTDKELMGMFGTGNDYYVFKENPTYAEAAAKVAEWEKHQEICVGDVVVPKSTKTPEILVLCTVHGMTGICITKGDQYGKMFERREFEGYEKTGRHIDVSAMLAQIGGEE